MAASTRVFAGLAGWGRLGVCATPVLVTAGLPSAAVQPVVQRLGNAVFPRAMPAAVPFTLLLPPATHRFFASSASASAAAKAKPIEPTLKYPGAPGTKYVTELKVLRCTSTIPTYRVMDEESKFLNEDYKMQVDKDELIHMYKTMRTLHDMDFILNDAQRQGRISFYMTCMGEEAACVGSAAGLQPTDLVYSQYREQGVLMYRGFGLQQFCDQCFSNAADLGKGRQMPIHYGSSELSFQTVSSPLATQIPHAAGAAYAFKREKSGRAVACYFGEGAASEGDFHAALNFAATMDCPVVFVCRNNGYAISTPARDQFRGDGIAARAAGYGMGYVRVDGNDLLAVQEATKMARDYAVENNKPILLELMSYRVGHHSTSDDSKRYRSGAEIEKWEEVANPINRVRLLLERHGWWDSQQEMALKQKTKKDVLTAFDRAEARKKPAIDELFNDVYAEVPPHLQQQKAKLQEHLDKHGDHYHLDRYA